MTTLLCPNISILKNTAYTLLKRGNIRTSISPGILLNKDSPGVGTTAMYLKLCTTDSRVLSLYTFSKLVVKYQLTLLQFRMILLNAFLTVMDKDMTQIISMHILVKKSS